MITNVDWEAVKACYLETRSYKKTAERFGVKPETVKQRAIRQRWGDISEDLSPERDDTPEDLSPERGDIPEDLSPERGDIPEDLSPERGDIPEDLSPERGDVPEDLSPEVTSDVANATPDATPDVANVTSFPDLPCLPNLTAKEAVMKRPWEAVVVPHDKLPDKASYRAFITAPGTQDCLFSGVVGEAANLRVSRDNRPAKLLAVVADYDTVFPKEKVEKMLAKLPVPPNFVSRSYSGGTHAVWVLERPLPLPPEDEAQVKLLAIIRKELKLNNAFGPLDTNAFCNLGQYYHAGWDWVCTNQEPVSAARTMLWVVDAAKRASKGSVPAVPMSVVAAEVERRFPGRWQGDFTVGARGVRFWDESADNPTAAIVTETGMLCFTGPVPFVSWEGVFGPGFVDKYREETLGRVLAECYFVNNTFYVKAQSFGTETWLCYNRQSMESLLSCRYGLRNRAGKDEDQSEVKTAISAIITNNALASARPFIYRQESIIPFDGQPVLNTSLLRVHPPEAGKGKSWGDGFPWIAAFLEDLFPDCIQRERFLCEWAYAYKHAYAGNPRNGRVIFIVGGPGVGKNFITEQLIGPSLGGSCDPSDYLLGRTHFTDDLFSKGVWLCNDTPSKGDERERRVFTSNLKRMAANARHICEGKYKGATSVEWSGRVYVTLNEDPNSKQMLPELDQSNGDKISLYQTGSKPLAGDRNKNKEHVARELGALCAYLLGMEYPEHCVGDSRWGVKGYKHEELRASVKALGETSSFAEIVMHFCSDMFNADPRLEALDGTSTWYLQRILSDEGLKGTIKRHDTPVSFGRGMANLVTTGTFPVIWRKTNTGSHWRIERKAFEEYVKFGAEEVNDDENVPF